MLTLCLLSSSRYPASPKDTQAERGLVRWRCSESEGVCQPTCHLLLQCIQSWLCTSKQFEIMGE